MEYCIILTFIRPQNKKGNAISGLIISLHEQRSYQIFLLKSKTQETEIQSFRPPARFMISFTPLYLYLYLSPQDLMLNTPTGLGNKGQAFQRTH